MHSISSTEKERGLTTAAEEIFMDKSKFNIDKDSSRRTYEGIVFDSMLEMKYYRDILCPLVESGDIVALKLQPKYILQPMFKHQNKTVRPITYIADFYIRRRDGREEVIDIKGCPDTAASIKRKLFWYVYPDIDYKWIGYSKIDGGWLPYDDIKKYRSLRKRAKLNVLL